LPFFNHRFALRKRQNLSTDDAPKLRHAPTPRA
jgi:hypothetical protein